MLAVVPTTPPAGLGILALICAVGLLGGCSQPEVGNPSGIVWMPAGATPGQRKCINSAGQAAVDITIEGRVTAAIWDSRTNAVLKVVADDQSRASAINRHAQLIGTIDRAGMLFAKAFLFAQDGLVILPDLGSTPVFAADINDLGQVVGSSGTASGRICGFVWDGAMGIRALRGENADQNTYAVAINNSGDIAGNINVADKTTHPALWKKDNACKDLGLVDGFETGYAVDMNSKGAVLVAMTKSSKDLGSLPFVWTEDRGYRRVSIPALGGYLTPVCIDDNGKVLVSVTTSEGEKKSIVCNATAVALPPIEGNETTKYCYLENGGAVVGLVENGEKRQGFVERPLAVGE